MRMGDILTQMNRFAEAAAAYQQLQSQYPESIMIDRMLMKLGEVYQLGLNDKPRAIESFKTLLERFPNSIYVNEARKRIRDLRGDTL
jgi:TolA-binding protein